MHILPKRFESFKSSYLLLKANNDKTIEDISSSLILRERNAATKSGEVLSAASIPRNQEKKQSNSTCKYCNTKGHWVRQCAKRKTDGKPPHPARAGSAGSTSAGSEGGKSKGSQVNVTDSRVTLVSINSNRNMATTKDQWWIDNGGTRHILYLSLQLMIEISGANLNQLTQGVIRLVRLHVWRTSDHCWQSQL